MRWRSPASWWSAVRSTPSRRPRCDAGCARPRSNRGGTAAGSSPEIRSSRSPAAGWSTSTSGSGTVGSSPRPSSWSAPMRRPRSSPGPVGTARCPPQRIDRSGSSTKYQRIGALAYLAGYDVHRGTVIGRTEPTTGIEPFHRLGRSDHERRTVRQRADRLPRRGQRFLTPRPGGGGPDGRVAPQRGAGSHSGACVLAQPSIG